MAAIPTRTRDAGIFGRFPGTHSPLDFGVGFPSAAKFIVLPVSDFLALSPDAGAFGWFRGPLPLHTVERHRRQNVPKPFERQHEPH